MSLVLYVGNKRYSSWSLRPYLALAHAGAEFTTETIFLDLPTTRAAIARVNPAGRVPVLHHDGAVIWDSLAICEYVHELYPEAGLWPAERGARARARAIAAEMHAGFPQMRHAMPMDMCMTKSSAISLAVVHQDIGRIQDVWRTQLAVSGGPFLFGSFTIADAMYAPVASRFVTYRVGLEASCEAYIDTILGLPALQAWRRDAATEPELGK